ncbi:General transcription factor II-I repeat domain-containing protein 2, partial [Stegodyphus mimosarum]
MENCSFFSLQMDESADLTNISQLAICVKMVFSDFTTKEEFLKVLPLKESTREEDIFSTFKKYITDVKLPVQKLLSVTTDGAPAMTGKKKGFIALCRQNSLFPKFISHHCLIHQEMLCAKTIGFQYVFTIATKIINSIRSGAMQHRLFKLLLEDEDVQFTDLLLNTEVRWLSRGKILERFIMLLPQIKEFIASRSEFYEQLENKGWLIDLGFLTDITAKFNELNLKIQGKNQHIASAWEKEGIIEDREPSAIKSGVHYLSHRLVIKLSSTTQKSALCSMPPQRLLALLP